MNSRHVSVIRTSVLGLLLGLGVMATAAPAQATGLGNLTYTAQELYKPVSNFGGEGATKWPTGPTGANTVVMIHQKLVVMGSLDSGKPPGSLHVYDVSDPRKPVLEKTLDGTVETSKLRELHAMPVAMPDGKTLIVLPTTVGLQFFDFTDVLNPKPAGSFTLPGVNGGDYDNTLWMLSWEYPYVFAGGTGNGIFIVDATDPANCTLVKRVMTGEIGNFRIGPTYAAGNYVIGLNMDQVGTQVAVVDVGKPSNPVLAFPTFKTPASLYSSLVIGDHIYGPGTNGDYVMMKWTGTGGSVVATGKSGSDRGGYCTYQSPNLICGQSSEGFKKWDTTGDKLTFLGKGTDPNGPGGDFDFATVLGNLVFLGNDHGTGSALIPHQMEPDTTAPAVVKVFPSEARQPVTTRITIFFTEDLDLDTVSATNIIVRSVDGTVVPGTFSRSSFNAISFGPKASLAPNTTYEVSVPASGVTDLVGNKIKTPTAVRFSTGPTIDTTGVVTGGSGGTSAGGASGAGGADTSSSAGQGGALSSGGTSGAAGASTNVGGAAGSVTSSTGGSALVAGSAPVSAGAPGSAGSAGAAAIPPTPNADSGCSCSMPGGQTPASIWALALGALALGVGRSRGRARRRGDANQA